MEGDGYLDRLKKLDSHNREILSKYVRNCELRQMTRQTIQSKTWRVYGFLTVLNFKALDENVNEDIEDFIICRRKIVSPFTLQGDIVELKTFFKWFKPDNTFFNSPSCHLMPG